MKTCLTYVALFGFVMAGMTLVFIEVGFTPLFGSFKPSYEAATAYGVLCIAAASLFRLVFGSE